MMRKQIREAMYWTGYGLYAESGREPGTVAVIWAMITGFLADAIRRGECRWFGHDYEVTASGENGTEDIFCRHCGDSQHFQF